MINKFLIQFFLFICVCFGHLADKKVPVLEESSIVKELEVVEGEVLDDDDTVKDRYSKSLLFLPDNIPFNSSIELNSFYKTQLFSRIYSYIRIPQFNKNIPNAPPVLPFLV